MIVQRQITRRTGFPDLGQGRRVASRRARAESRRIRRPRRASLLGFIDASPSPYHAVAEAARRLAAAGFAERRETDGLVRRAGPGLRASRRQPGGLGASRAAVAGAGLPGGRGPHRQPQPAHQAPARRRRRRAGASSASRSTAGCCSTRGSTATSGCRDGWACARRPGPRAAPVPRRPGRCCGCPSWPSTSTAT